VPSHPGKQQSPDVQIYHHTTLTRDKPREITRQGGDRKPTISREEEGVSAETGKRPPRLPAPASGRGQSKSAPFRLLSPPSTLRCQARGCGGCVLLVSGRWCWVGFRASGTRFESHLRRGGGEEPAACGPAPFSSLRVSGRPASSSRRPWGSVPGVTQ
jgi:hypothetical protein